ncbi:MAG: hypothetical protein H6851_04350 [Geminicoccaceae bacterium]|nr:hypothetical protein [Geminicoccaceae bacterium]
MSTRGLALRGPHGPVRLKWHKLRSAAGVPPHDRSSLREGLARGALLEVDLQTTADGHWVCLHDDTLDGETTGSGIVAETPRAAMESLRQRAVDGQVQPDRLLFLDELVAIVAGFPHGRVQLDIKSGSGKAGERFGEIVAAHANRFDIGGHDWPLVHSLAVRAPGIVAGFDPCDRFADRDFTAWCRLIESVDAREARLLYLAHQAVSSALDENLDLVAFAHRRGQEVDCWTIDPDMPDALRVLERVIGLGADRITTNDPLALEALWCSIS